MMPLPIQTASQSSLTSDRVGFPSAAVGVEVGGRAIGAAYISRPSSTTRSRAGGIVPAAPYS